ncbi:TPM domain-containing protein [Streptomyces sp. NPDC057428]|uniref:TPM domain-containing protein n=1 Tax=Streptomyces sp. NPDC057428 TaxID=3346129 RepID=UPI00369B0BB8
MTPSASRTGSSRPSIPGRVLLAALTAVLWILLPGSPPATADGPVPLSRDGRIPGTVGALGNREPQVEAALDRLYRDRRVQLFVVYVRGFSGRDSVLAGEPVPAPAVTPGTDDPGGSGGDGASVNLIVPVAVLVVAVAVAVFTLARRKRRTAIRTTPAPGGGARAAAAPRLALPELDARAKADLVDTDDAVRTSEEELGFATAQFGEEAAAPFADAVRRAGAELTTAFRLRQQLDDAFPEDDETRRGMLDEIISRCADANGRLDAVSEDFDRLRALEQTAPQAVNTAEITFRELLGRVSAAETAVGALRERYAEPATAPAAQDVERAKDRLVFTTSSLNQARQAVDGGDSARAAVYVRAAEGAIQQVSTLVDGVDRRSRELAEAAAGLPGALTGMETDLADARGLLRGTPQGVSTADLQGRVARAEAVNADVRGELDSGPYDPVDALRRVEEADAALDGALAGAREQEHAHRRARSLLDQSLLTAGASTGAAADYVTTNRGAVGSQARTRLAEAQRRYERARELSEAGDPQGALSQARQADALARQARSLAEQDVRNYRDRSGPGGTRGGGGTGGAVLGGIILGGLLGEGGRGGGPGSFGGGATRGRRGGGRF